MKKLFLLIISIFIFKAVHSQEQSAVFSHYHINPILISPAYAGFAEDHRIHMNIRNQWTGFTEAPKSYGIGYNGPIGKTLGLGLGLMSETLGNLSNVRLQLNYAFRYQIKDVKFAAGFSTEFLTRKLSQSVLESPLYEHGDLVIEDAVEGNKLFDASLGLYSTFKDKTFVGLTFSNLVVARIGDIESGGTDGSLFRYVMFNFGHEFDIEQYNFKLRPSMLIQHIKNKPFQADFNLVGSFVGDKLIAGASYRAGLGGAVGLLLGTNIDVFKLYYSYDLTFQSVQKYNGGTHEVTIAFDFDGGKKKFDRSQPNGRR